MLIITHLIIAQHSSVKTKHYQGERSASYADHVTQLCCCFTQVPFSELIGTSNIKIDLCHCPQVLIKVVVL